MYIDVLGLDYMATTAPRPRWKWWCGRKCPRQNKNLTMIQIPRRPIGATYGHITSTYPSISGHLKGLPATHVTPFGCRRLWKARAPLRRDGWTVSSDGLTWFCWAFLFRGRGVKGTNGMLLLLPLVDDDLGMLPCFCVLLLVVLIWTDDAQKSKCWCSSWSLVEFLTRFSQVYEHELCKSASFTPSFRKMYQMWTKIISSYSYLTEIMFVCSVVHISPYNSQNAIWPSMWLKTNTHNVLKSKMVSKNHIESNICCSLLCKWSLPVFRLIQKELQKKTCCRRKFAQNSLRASDRRPGVVYLLTSSSCSNWRVM